MSARRLRLTKGGENTCPKCGDENISNRAYSDTVDFRGLELDVEGLQESKCAACGHMWASDAQLENNNAVIRTAYGVVRDKLRMEYGLLSGEEIARIRAELKLNQKSAAVLFGGGANAFNKYESGEVLQSFAMDRLIRLAKIIGTPIIKFLSNVNAPVPFLVIPVTSFGRGGFTHHMLIQEREARLPAFVTSTGQFEREHIWAIMQPTAPLQMPAMPAATSRHYKAVLAK